MADGLTGNLAQMPIGDMLRMLAGASWSGRLELVDKAEHGVICLRNGAIVHAVSGPLSGEEAFYELATWTSGLFRFEPNVPAPEITIARAVADLLTEAARLGAEQEAMRRAIPSTDRLARISARPPEQPVTLQPIEWQVVAALGGQRTISALPTLLGIDELTVLRALKGLVEAGLVEVEAHAAPVAPKPVAGADFFRTLTAAASAALGPMAPVIIDEEIAALGLTREAFPADRVSSLVERVASEIRDDDRRIRFQQTLIATLRQQAA